MLSFRKPSPPLILDPLKKEVELYFLMAVSDILSRGYAAEQPMILCRVHDLGMRRQTVCELTKLFLDVGYITYTGEHKAVDTWRSWVIARDPGVYAHDIRLTPEGSEVLQYVLMQNNPQRIKCLRQMIHGSDATIPVPHHT
jgi:hypothetical protein